MSLADQIQEELKRVQELKQWYMEIPMGFIGATLIQNCIDKTIKALAEGDVVQLLKCYNELKDFE